MAAALITTIAPEVLQLIETYGREAVTGIETLVAQIESTGSLTLADVEAAYAPLEPYGAYQIRLVKAPVTAPVVVPPPVAAPAPATPPTA